MDFSKALFYATSGAGVVGAAFVFGLYSGTRDTIALNVAREVKRAVSSVTAEASTLTGVRPKHFLQPARHNREGITINEAPEGELVLLAGFFDDTNEIRLVRRDGSIVARWPVRFSELFPNTDHLRHLPATDWNIDTHGALALPDGSVLFNFEAGGLVKLNRCGETEWTLNRVTHHSVERAEGGGFWVPGRRYVTNVSDFPPFIAPYSEDTILRVSEAGEVLSEFSVPQLFYDNGLEALLTSTAGKFKFRVRTEWDSEIVHLNKVGELPADLADRFPMFEAGDLMLSLRTLNLVMVIDPVTREIKWWKIGPWLRQHDPEFMANGKVAVFNNNNYVSGTTTPRASSVIDVDPTTGVTRVLYEKDMRSVVRGKIEPTRSGLIITEFEGGRAFEVDQSGDVIWEYVNRYDSDFVAEITEARVYPTDYFSVSDWVC